MRFWDFCISSLTRFTKNLIHRGNNHCQHTGNDLNQFLKRGGRIKPGSCSPVGLMSSQVIGLQSSAYVKDSCTCVKILQ